MQDEFANRLGMFNTALGTLNSPVNKPTWENQPPTIFTTKVAQAQQAFDDLQSFVTDHGRNITGAAEDKQREEKEVEDAAFELSQTLFEWFSDQNDMTSAAKVDRPISGWHRMRDQELLSQSKIARDLAQAVVDGPQATDAAAYGIDATSVQALSAEIDDYEAAITAPQQKIALRKSMTAQFRPRFNEVEGKFESLDRLILRFGNTAAGRALIAAHKASRIIRDLGAGGSPAPPESSPTSE